MASEIAVPFRLDGNGRVVTVTDPDVQVRQHIMALVNTHPDERPMIPGYGVDLTPLPFSDADTEEIAAQVSIRVRAAAQQFEPGVEVMEVVPEPDDNDGTRRMTMEYRRLDAPDSSSVANANVAVIGANGTVREVVRG